MREARRIAANEEAGHSADGRVRRGERNREAILQAVLELVGAGELRPTAEQVAQRAGVGMRTVFRHFADMESLFAEMTARMEREVRPLFERAPPTGTPEERGRALVERRFALYERIGPFKRSANLARRSSPFLQRDHASMVRGLRADLLRAFPELAEAPEALVEALDYASSFEAWDRLRGEQRLGRERAQGAMERAVLALLASL